MRIFRSIIILFSLLLFVGLVTADPVPDQSSSISTSANWVVVNHPATITVVAHNETSGYLSGATVNVALENTDLGSLVMAGTTTDALGEVSGTFNAGTKSGAVNITATITKDGSSVTKTITQYIDHDVPYTVQFYYDGEVTVDTETPFTMRFTDHWGNPIDNKKPGDSHAVSLHIGSVTGAAAFDSGGTFVQDLTQNTDANGNVTVTVRTDIVGGENIIWMKAFGSVGDQYKSIIGLTNAVPFSMTQALSPSPAMQPCDGAADHTFTFIYTLYDKHGNIAENQSILLHTSWAGDTDTTFTTNEFGQIWLTYGPHETAADISITATSVTNSSVSATSYVEFYSTAPENMQLTASPQTMGSLDAGSSIRSNISAEVTDEKGNPVKNETVTFTIGTPWYDGTYNITAGPRWESTPSDTVTGTTTEDGFATVKFMPGAFSRNKTDLNYNPQATGHVTVTAKWVNPNGTAVLQNLQLNWKNYPYLSVDTSVSPLTIGVNDTVDLTIKMKGDGWALQPNPIDVELVLDRSGSMGYDLNGNSIHWGSTTPSRLSIAKSAASTFVNNMSEGQDRVGLFSYASDVSHDATLQTTFSSVKTAISNLNANGATATRDATKKAIDDLVAHPNADSDAVRAVIVMTDGDWNYYGAPNAKGNGFPSWDYTLNNNIASWSGGATDYNTFYYYTDLGGGNNHYASVYVPNDDPNSGGSTVHYYHTTASYYDNAEFTNQNLSVYAKNNNIRLYFIFFASSPAATSQSTLQTMANATGGYYQQALTETALNDAYKKIAGDLQEAAGVNTTMQVVFNNVNVSGVTFPGADVYQYVYDPSASTKITWQDGNANVTDQTTDWNDDHNLNFNIGTITLNQVWQATMRFRMLKPGNIEVFSGSSVIFNNGTDQMDLPVKYVNVIPNLSNPGWSMQAIQITDLRANPTGGKIVDTLPVTWNLTYPGNITRSATEQVFWSNDNKQSWHQFYAKSGIAPCTNSLQASTLDVRNLPSGTYWIRVKASADDAVGDEAITATGIDIGTAGKSYIKLE